MNNKEFVDCIIAVDTSLRKLESAIDEMLSQPDVDYEITLYGCTFDISKPVIKEDKKSYIKSKKKAIKLLIKKSLSLYLKKMHKPPTDDLIVSIWGIMASLQVFKPKEERQALIASEIYEVPTTEIKKSVPLDINNPYVKMQNRNITDEERIAILMEKDKE